MEGIEDLRCSFGSGRWAQEEQASAECGDLQEERESPRTLGAKST